MHWIMTMTTLTLILPPAYPTHLRAPPAHTIAAQNAVHAACDLSHRLVDGRDPTSNRDAVASNMFNLLYTYVDSLGKPLARLVNTVHDASPSFLKTKSKDTLLKISHLVCNDPLVESTSIPLSSNYGQGTAVRFADDKATVQPAKGAVKKTNTVESSKGPATATNGEPAKEAPPTETASTSTTTSKSTDTAPTDTAPTETASPETTSSSPATTTKDTSTAEQKSSSKASATKSEKKPVGPVATPGQDQCALLHSDGMSCKGFRSHDNKPSWCCRGECKSQHRFQAECDSICPQDALAGSDCSRSLSISSSYCCPKKGSNAMQCISENNFETQCPSVEPTKGETAFKRDKTDSDDPVDEEVDTESDAACTGVDGKSGITKFCSTKEQEEAARGLSPTDDITYEYYCCKEKCVSSSVYVTFCCDPNDAQACHGRQLKARQAAGFLRVLRIRDDITGTRPPTNALVVPSSSLSEDALFPSDKELNPFQSHALHHVHSFGPDSNVDQIVRSGPGAMAPPSGWPTDVPADHEKTGHQRSHYPMVPPQFERPKKKTCCDKEEDNTNSKMLRPKTITPRSFQEYDPFPTNNPVCPISMLTVRREDAELDGVSPKEVAQHIARFTGLWDVHIDSKIVQGQLYAPARLPMAISGAHFFSDIDGRSNYAVMGTPGGDTGEFILALCAMDHARDDLNRHKTQPGKKLTLPDVRNLLAAWIDKIANKRKYFFMQTDRTALSRLEAAVGVPNFLTQNYTSMDHKLKQLIVDLSVLPEHVGSTHLRLMLTNANEYGCRTETVEYVMTAFWEMLLQIDTGLNKEDSDYDYDSNSNSETSSNSFAQQLSNTLLYHVNRGYHQESAVVSVYALEGECPNAVPMVVPGANAETDAGDTPVTQVIVHHPSAVAPLRAELAEFLIKYSHDLNLDGASLIRHMNALGSQGLDRTLETLAHQKPRFAVFFTEHPF